MDVELIVLATGIVQVLMGVVLLIGAIYLSYRNKD